MSACCFYNKCIFCTYICLLLPTIIDRLLCLNMDVVEESRRAAQCHNKTEAERAVTAAHGEGFAPGFREDELFTSLEPKSMF